MCSSGCSADEGHLRASWIFKQLLGAEVSIRRSLRLCFHPLSCSLFNTLSVYHVLSAYQSMVQDFSAASVHLLLWKTTLWCETRAVKCTVMHHGNLVLSVFKCKMPVLIKTRNVTIAKFKDTKIKPMWLISAASKLWNIIFMHPFFCFAVMYLKVQEFESFLSWAESWFSCEEHRN